MFCIGCPIGKFTTEDLSMPCLECPKGWKGIQDGITMKCKECGVGQYQSVAAVPFCLPCLPGYFQYEKGQPQCLNCTVGMYMADVESSESVCKHCEQGRYQNQHAQANCVGCPAGKWNSDEGAISELQCVECHAAAIQILRLIHQAVS